MAKYQKNAAKLDQLRELQKRLDKEEASDGAASHGATDALTRVGGYFANGSAGTSLSDLARTGKEKLDIAQYITDQYGYDLSPTCDDIRPHYHFDVTCQGTVPQAIIAWLDSDCFEDAIRNAISLGGDADTLAAITGAIAQADYGIPPLIAAEAFRRLDAPLRDVLLRFERQVMAGKV